jgi:excisionase family DNA binding protein
LHFRERSLGQHRSDARKVEKMKSKSQKVADQGANEPLESTKFFAITEVAEMVGVSTRSVRRWIKRDELAAHRFGASVRIAESDLKVFFSQHRGK